MRTYALFTVIAAISTLTCLSYDGEKTKADPHTADGWSGRVVALRRAGRYAEALRESERLRADLQSDLRSPSWVREDAARMVATCARAAALPESSQQALAAADRAQPLILELLRQGSYRRAAAAARDQWTVRRRLLGDRHEETAAALSMVAEVSYWRGDRAGAAELQRQALDIRRAALGERNPPTAESEAALGRAEKGIRHLDAARRLHDAALAMRRELFGSHSLEVAGSLVDRADVLRAMRNYGPARADLDEALRIRRRLLPPGDPRIAEVKTQIGLILIAQGKWKQAVPLVREAAISDRNHPGSRAEARALSASLYAETLKRQGRWRDSEQWTLASIRLYDAVRAEGLPGFPPGHPLSDWWRVAILRIVQGNGDAAWSAVERSLHRGLLDAICPPDTAESVDSPLGDASFDPRFCTLPEVQKVLPPDGAIVGWLEDNHTARNGFLDYPFWAYVIHSEGPVIWIKCEAPPGTEEGAQSSTIARLEVALRLEAGWPIRTRLNPELMQRGRDVYRERIEPILPSLRGVRQLLIVKAASAGFAPLEAAVDSAGNFMADRFLVSYIPSATLFVRMRERGSAPPPARHWNALLVGDHTGDQEPELLAAGSRSARQSGSSYPPLAGAREELHSLERIFPSARLLVGPGDRIQDLRRLALEDSLRRFDLVHIATHFSLSAVSPMESGIVFSGPGQGSAAGAPAGTEGIELLRADEIGSFWRLNADLVTVSGCGSGRGTGMMTDLIGGIDHALLASGARVLLVSAWDVDDTATEILMRRFYEDLTGAYRDERAGRIGQPMCKPLALQEARRWLRGQRDATGGYPYEDPAYWAAFTLIGDPGAFDSPTR